MQLGITTAGIPQGRFRPQAATTYHACKSLPAAQKTKDNFSTDKKLVKPDNFSTFTGNY